MTKVTLDELGDAILDAVIDYGENVKDGINLSTERHGRVMRDVAKDNAPVDKGDYKKSLSVSVRTGFAGTKTATVYAKAPHYRLVHLLEKGHAKVGGGRTRAFPHMNKGLKAVEKPYIEDIKKIIEEGGK